jgi:5-(carboxyamino)imidazole ribonucleotide mutase
MIKVSIIMGSKSDFEVMNQAGLVLKELNIAYENKIISAHRTPERLFSYSKGAKERKIEIIIAGAGGAAHLPGMVASLTTIPVLGVPIDSSSLNGLDSLLSIVQMPAGVPVATFAIGESGAKNAAIFAATIIALKDETVAKNLTLWRQNLTDSVKETPDL